MEKSETQQRIINLGKKIVKELGLDPGVDTLSRWMAHYIAEQLEAAESAVADEEKVEIKQRCFETILKLWQHRSAMPSGSRPFENFEPIFRALENLDPENKENYFFRFHNRDAALEPNVKQWLDIAQDIDQVSRIWLEYVFKQATLCASDKKTRDWLNHSIGFEDEVLVVNIIYPGEDSDEKKRERIKSRIEKLKSFNAFNSRLISILEKELSDIPKENSSISCKPKHNEDR